MRFPSESLLLGLDRSVRLRSELDERLETPSSDEHFSTVRWHWFSPTELAGKNFFLACNESFKNWFSAGRFMAH